MPNDTKQRPTSHIQQTIQAAVKKLQQLEFDLDREEGSRRLLKSEFLVLQTELVNKNVLSWSDFI